MQTLEEKKALLQRAMDDGLEVIINGGNAVTVLAVEYTAEAGWEAAVKSSKSGIHVTSLSQSGLRIIEPPVTADDLCEAILTILPVSYGDTVTSVRTAKLEELNNLAAKYREQNGGEVGD